MDTDRRRNPTSKEAQREGRRSCTSERLRQLIRRIQNGDWTAARELYAQLEPMVLSAMAPFRADPELYSDVRGEAYLALYRLALGFDETRGVNPFTYFERTLRPAVQTAVDRARRPAQRELRLDDPGPPAGDAGPAGQGGWQRLRTDHERSDTAQDACLEEAVIVRLAIRKAISRLTARERAVVALWQAGYHAAEMAEVLGIRADACRQILHRARARLRAELKKEIG